VLAGVTPAVAVEFEVFIEVEDETGLYDLRNTGQIDDQTLTELIDLLKRGVDLNRAGRERLYSLPNLSLQQVDQILAYRRNTGDIAHPEVLVRTGVLEPRELAALRPFLTPRLPAQPALAGQLRYRTIFTSADTRPPPMALELRVDLFERLEIGLVSVLSRNRVNAVRFDPVRDALSAAPPRTRVELPKAYVYRESPHWEVIAGTYRIGFGQRLVFDNTGRFTPNGIDPDDTIARRSELVSACREVAGELAESPCSGRAGELRVTPDFTFTERLRGVAMGVRGVRAGIGTVDLHTWFSLQTFDVNQFAVFDAAQCADPRDDDNPACAAPKVFRRRASLLAPASRFSRVSLPDMFNEWLGGARVAYQFGARTRLALLGYGAAVDWVPEGIALDFQEWATRPPGGAYGAIGAELTWGRAWADVAVEAARSFDADPRNQAGSAVVVRQTSTWKRNQLEAVFRWYGEGFANPYARPIAAADEFEGNRARDEVGGRLRYTGKIGALTLRASADAWMQPRERVPKLDVSLRGDYALLAWWRPGFSVEFRDKNLKSSSRRNCFSAGSQIDAITGEPVPCGGELYRLTLRSRFEPWRDLAATLQFRQTWRDDGTDAFDSGFRQDRSTTLIVTAKPVAAVRLRARLRYRFDDVAHRDRLEQSIWSYFDATYKPTPGVALSVRYDVRKFLDKRASTQTRTPNPEHWLHGTVTARF